MSVISVKSVKNSVINKSEIKVKKVKDYTDEERKKIALKFINPEIYGKGKILGDIVSPLYKEV